MNVGWIVSIAWTVLAVGLDPAAQELPSVGLPARLEQVVLKGPELEVRPADIRTPLVLRIAAVYPHGTDHRYDFEYYALEPGTFDLRNYLRRRNGDPVDDLPPLRVEVRSILPAGQVKPTALEVGEHPRVGGYRTLLVAGGVAWTVGLLALLVLARRGRGDESGRPSNGRPASLADRLLPLVERAAAGRLPRDEQAALEMSLVSLWRRRLDLEAVSSREAIATLKAHDEAGPLLRGLEDWLHRPTPPADVDLAELLRPYRDLPADELVGRADGR